MTSHQRYDLVRYLAWFAVACLSWEILGLTESIRMMAGGEVNSLRNYSIPVPDAFMAFLTQSPLRSEMSAAVATAMGLAVVAGFSTIATGRLATSILAVLVATYAITGLSASVAVLWLIRLFMGETSAMPFATESSSIFSLNDGVDGLWQFGDLEGALESLMSLGVLVARAAAVAAAGALLWSNWRPAAATATRRFVVPTSQAPASTPSRGGIRTSGG